MNRVSIWLLAFAALILAGLGLYRWGGERSVPDAEFVTIKGEHIRLRELRGHPVLVTFWASDCRACIEELPDLAELYREFSGRGLKLISVAMAYDLPSRVVSMAEANKLPYPVALDPLGRLAETFGQVRLVPNSFLIGPDGHIVMHQLGRIDVRNFREKVERLLEEA
ncbi:peroxiredoxin family protein [Methylocaldum szegediense]|mgnify:CR=1 FL=1|uniref:Cytochrome c biogenesis protein CcmG, thiol:disulfide interchange protein DsbE n=1 Tax=Methylocaldum szegediense TaxID=73780 RepID=A0ABM9HX56_9GAMM|nr:TlpA disulfide reductase family protein [Methylocaldum szegediense]CAI8743554.1 cytochrome c biogenesis protein CcmG, thiol:disulfide interchange protein DsbE [Methylocaldum szegediense]